MAPAQPRETIDLILLGGERSDETRKDFVAAEIQATAWANVISGPGSPQLRVERKRQGDKYQISFDGPNWRQAYRNELICKPISHGIGMARELEPPTLGQAGRKLRGKEAVLGQKMAGAFAPFGHERGAGGIEDHDGFSRERSDLR